MKKDQLSSEDIFFLVRCIYPEMGIATLYLSLDLLTEFDIVNKFNFGNGAELFNLFSDEQIQMHHYLICKI
ncbi:MULTISPECIES: transcriptional repressor [unclassified Paenibacillus]|uniref:transcriptional repressor n=1 Tax=unclassified Paenibacillus TaxID=185978 RepID=UPI002F3F9FB9